MTDYPAAANFLRPMPAYPVNVSCEFFKNVPNINEEEKEVVDPKATELTARQKLVFTALRDAANVYFDYDNALGYCMNGDDTEAIGNLAADGWEVLTCNQIPMPDSTGTKSMFIPTTFNYLDWTLKCQHDYGLTPDYHWALREFGGYNVTRDF